MRISDWSSDVCSSDLYGLLESRALSERVATQLKLTDSQNFFELFGFESDDPAFALANCRYPASGRATRQRVAGEILRAHLSLSPTRMSRLVAHTFTLSDTAFSANESGKAPCRERVGQNMYIT